MKFKLTHLAPVLAAGAAVAAIVAAPIASAATIGQSCGGAAGEPCASRLGTFRSTTRLALSSSSPMGARPSCWAAAALEAAADTDTANEGYAVRPVVVIVGGESAG